MRSLKKEKSLFCPICETKLKKIKKDLKLGAVILCGTEIYICPLCEEEVLTPEQIHDAARRAKRAKVKAKKKRA
jgi:uncharacterized Zn finger protein (UPF0148 family)